MKIDFNPYDNKETINIFLYQSTETAKHSKYYSKLFLNNFSTSNTVVDWIDFGSSSGSKFRQIASNLYDWGAPKFNLTATEPSKYWYDRMQEILPERYLGLNLSQTILTSFDDYYKKKKNFKKYDLITFMHSAYGIKINSFFKFKWLSKLLSKRGLCSIIVESPNSDMHKLKERLFDVFNYKKEEIFSNKIQKSLEMCKYNITWNAEEIGNQRLYLDYYLNDNSSFVHFLMITLQGLPDVFWNHKSLKIIKKEAEKFIEEKAKDDKGNIYIEIPDIAFQVSKKQ